MQVLQQPKTYPRAQYLYIPYALLHIRWSNTTILDLVSLTSDQKVMHSKAGLGPKPIFRRGSEARACYRVSLCV